MTPAQEAQAQQCLNECQAHIAAGEHEATLRSVFNSHLRAIAGTPLPWWAREHFVKTEALLRSTRAGRAVTGFADNLVGLTAIEYEKNLTSPAIFNVGFRQVREYVAGLLNKGAHPGSVRGVLSDTVRWYAYEVDAIAATALPGHIAGDEVFLRPATGVHMVDGSSGSLAAARQLHGFLQFHLGRAAGQVLAADTLKDMLGLESDAGRRFLADAEALVEAAFVADPGYASMVQGLWANFVSFVGTTDAQAGRFDKQAYVYELYLLTLAKLVAANVLVGHAAPMSLVELRAVLDGQYFRAQGLTNLVEYDYFGWLTKPPHLTALLRLAEDIQQDLTAFNFAFLQAQDLFGQLVTQLAERTQRLLLGQEPTPSWLVAQMVDSVESRMGEDEPWRFVDPCCGSGAFVVEVIARRIRAPGFSAMSREQRGQELSQTITGFDVDPLAVMLAKVSWLVAAKPALQPFNSGFPASIPIYHADSLFASTPLALSVTTNSSGNFDLVLDKAIIALPRFLTSPALQPFFDEFIDGLYRLAQVSARSGNPPAPCQGVDVRAISDAAETSTGTALDPAQRLECVSFGLVFGGVLADLEFRGRNGLWMYMLKNGYRPALVQGKFNAVVTNFPWLALSKLADNPYKSVLQAKTQYFNLQPASQSALHLELATIFLLHAAKHYLGDRGLVAAVVPNSVVQGNHHEPLRSGMFRIGPRALQLHFLEVWNVARSAFGTTNVAAVLIGEKGVPEPAGLLGRSVDEGGNQAYPLFLSTLNERNAWTTRPLNMAAASNFDFLQGADLFPRTCWFHEVAPVPGPGGTLRLSLSPIPGAASPNYQLITNAKLCKQFRAVPTTVASRWGFGLVTSTQLMQFQVDPHPVAILPFQQRTNAKPVVEVASAADVAADSSAAAHFQRVFAALQQDDGWRLLVVDPDVVYRRLNFRNKISAQRFSVGDTLVLYPASGTYAVAAKLQVTPQNFGGLIIDQTLYWMVVNDQDKADYLVGLINSGALADTIRPFQPLGVKGPRHIHELPPAVIPAWNATDPQHQDVVRLTRQLIAEWQSAVAGSVALQKLVATPADVATRRTALREAIARLPSYASYEAACALVV